MVKRVESHISPLRPAVHYHSGCDGQGNGRFGKLDHTLVMVELDRLTTAKTVKQIAASKSDHNWAAHYANGCVRHLRAPTCTQSRSHRPLFACARRRATRADVLTTQRKPTLCSSRFFPFPFRVSFLLLSLFSAKQQSRLVTAFLPGLALCVEPA